MQRTLVAAAAIVIAAPAVAWAEVSARLRPDTVSAGQVAQLTITVDDPRAQPRIGPVDGLLIAPRGQSSRTSIINGVVSTEHAFVYLVQPQRPGTFRIDDIRAGGERAAPVTLTATRGAPPASSPEPDALQPTPLSELAKLRLTIDDDNGRIYVGESVPFTVRALFRGGIGVSLSGPPALSSDAFTVSGLDAQPTQRETRIDGEPYLAVTWSGTLTAAKATDEPIAVSLPATLQYRERVAPPQRRRSPFDDPFSGGDPFAALGGSPFGRSPLDDPMFQDFFGRGFGPVQTRQVTLRAAAGNTEIAALPAEGRPDDFSGAVGSFEIAAELDDTALLEGEPVALRIAIAGEGNFAAVDAPGLAESDTWRAYAPHARFEPTDDEGHAGIKTFEQLVVARAAGEQTLPPVVFSYFDPKAERYVTAATAPIPVTVTASAQPALAAGGRSVELSDDALAVAELGGPTVDTLARGGVPGWLLPAMIALLGGALAFAITGAVVRSRWALRRSASWRSRRAVARQRRAMADARARGDAVAFFRAARQAIQHRLAPVWGVTPESISRQDLDARWPDAPAELREVFDRADRVDYFRAGDAPDADLDDWSRRLGRRLATPEVPS